MVQKNEPLNSIFDRLKNSQFGICLKLEVQIDGYSFFQPPTLCWILFSNDSVSFNHYQKNAKNEKLPASLDYLSSINSFNWHSEYLVCNSPCEIYRLGMADELLFLESGSKWAYMGGKHDLSGYRSYSFRFKARNS